MLDRSAESLFWIGRYIERAENHARLLDVHYHMRELGGDEEESVWRTMTEAIGDTGVYEARHATYNERDVLYFLLLDPSMNNSLLSCVVHARDNFKKVREQLPAELWNMLNGFYLWLRGVQLSHVLKQSPHRFFQRIIEELAAFQGMAASIMLRDESWHLIESGRFLERSENVVRMLLFVHRVVRDCRDAAFAHSKVVLTSTGGYEAFRKLELDDMSLEGVARFLILEDRFPRSVQYAVGRFEQHLKALKAYAERSNPPLDRLIRIAGKARSELGCLEKEDITAHTMHDVLQGLLAANRQLGDAMANVFFSPGSEVVL
mgnify:FL=1